MEFLAHARRLAAPFALALSACGASPDPAQKPRTAALNGDRERASYMVGLDLARQVRPVDGEVDLDIVVQALRDALVHRKPQLDDAEIETIRRRFTRHMREKRAADMKALAAKNTADGDALLDANAKRPGVRTTSSGLQYQVLRDATGPKPKAGDTVDVNYVVKRADGFVLDDTYAVGHSASFPLNRTLPGLAEAIELMPMGSQLRVWIPGRLAWGENGYGAEIPPNQLLIYEIELLAIAGQPDGHPAGD